MFLTLPYKKEESDNDLKQFFAPEFFLLKKWSLILQISFLKQFG